MKYSIHSTQTTQFTQRQQLHRCLAKRWYAVTTFKFAHH